jgi:heme exporter protein A
MIEPASAIDDAAGDLPPLLRCRDLHFGYAGEALIEGIDLDLLPGRALLLLGANGSGKSTLLRLLAGLIVPDQGTVERASEADGAAIAVAWLGHVLGLKTGLTVAENLHFAIGLHGHGGRIGPPQALASVGLAGFEPVPVRELSAGQRKRVALARLLLLPAPLWLLDEPYANLDPEGCRLVDRLVDRHLRVGGSAVLSLHRADQAGFEAAAGQLTLAGVG